MNQWLDSYQIYMDVKFGQNIELIGIGDDLIFKVTAVEKLKVHGCGKVCG